ncbi:uncharacterized protein LOC141902585 [Tubulanus polymorphus]|uniref:uncharacterized protein LOC141902585 n=1 Tax=Tubulanus polymorphus TaxID=672921 RepID=UPI003DA49C84
MNNASVVGATASVVANHSNNVEYMLSNATKNGNFSDYEAKYDQWPETPLDRIEYSIHLYVPPFLIVIGTIGNILSYVVQCRPHMMQSSSAHYLAVLAFSNTVALLIGCGTDWMSRNLLKQHFISDLTDWLCKIWKFLFAMSVHFPTWLVVAMSIDRSITVWNPRRAPQICTLFKARIFTIVIIVGLLCISVHAMWTYTLIDKQCYLGQAHHFFHTQIWPWIQAIMFSYIPLVIICFTSLILIIGHQRNKHNVQYQPELSPVVICVTISYFVLGSPSIIQNIVEYTLPTHMRMDNNVRAAVFLARAVTQVESCMNYSILIFWHMICNRNFVRELRDLFTFPKLRDRNRMQAVPTVEINGEGVKLDSEIGVTTL